MIIMKVVIWMMDLINISTHNPNDDNFWTFNSFFLRQNFLKILTKSISHNMEYHKWWSSTLSMLSAIFSFKLHSRHFSFLLLVFYGIAFKRHEYCCCTWKKYPSSEMTHSIMRHQPHNESSVDVEETSKIHLHIIMFHLH